MKEQIKDEKSVYSTKRTTLSSLYVLYLRNYMVCGFNQTLKTSKIRLNLCDLEQNIYQNVLTCLKSKGIIEKICIFLLNMGEVAL